MKYTDLRIQRFRNSLSIDINTSSTEYLSVEQVKRLRDELDLFLDDIAKNEKSHNSNYDGATIKAN
jgi:hypothetical protein